MQSKVSWYAFQRSSPAADDVKEDVKFLEEALRVDKKWLDEVEARVFVDAQTEVEKQEIKEWADDAEDAIDEWNFEQLRQRRSADGSFLSDLLMDPSFRIRVKNLRQRREEISEFDHILRLGQPLVPRRQEKKVDQPPLPTSSFPGDHGFYGREDDINMLVNCLGGDADPDERLSVVPILGVAGVGKTFLAQKVSEKVSHVYTVNVWLSVSRGRQMVDVMKEFVKSLPEGTRNFTQMEEIREHLKSRLDHRKVLLVLDDVCYETIDGNQWESLCSAFGGCAYGSVIMLTTTDARVAEETKTFSPYFLESLSGDICWSVFRKHAFSGFLPTDDRLVKIGQKIAKESEGSPLVAKALGLRLRHERYAEIWEEFLQRDMWDEVLPELRLSYHGLPAHLKRCFAYCAIFPQGYFFRKEELVRLWLAQGFVTCEVGESLEDAGIEFFNELFRRSFFRQSEEYLDVYVMPKLLHALAQSVTEDECITMENSDPCNLSGSYLQRVRHLSSKPSNCELSTKILSSATHLRSFLLLVPIRLVKDRAHVSLSDTIFNTSNCLRVLDLRHTDMSTLPSTIRNLKHLRYLNLSSTKIEHLDASVFQLYHLQTLDLSCTDINELPDALGNLGNLVHLLLSDTKITKLPKSIGNLFKLQTLHLLSTELQELPVEIGGLKQLNVLYLNVSKVQSLPESMCGVSNLRTLELQGVGGEESVNGVIADDRDLKEQVFRESIQTTQNLGLDDMADSSIREENLNGNLQSEDQVQRQDCHADRLIKWIGNPSLSRLVHVVLKGCVNCRSLPQLGRLPLLKRLEIDGMPIESVGQDFCGDDGNRGFPSLEELFFRNLNRWKIWDGVRDGELPRLEKLVIFNCPNLLKMPNLCSSSLAKVEVERCAVEALQVPNSVEELHLCACDKISKLPALDSLSNLTIMYCRSLESLLVPKNLESLWIEECEQLSSWKLSLPAELEVIMLSSTTFVAKPRNPSPPT